MRPSTEREALINKLADSMDPDNARAFVDEVIAEAAKGAFRAGMMEASDHPLKDEWIEAAWTRYLATGADEWIEAAWTRHLRDGRRR